MAWRGWPGEGRGGARAASQTIPHACRRGQRSARRPCRCHQPGRSAENHRQYDIPAAHPSFPSLAIRCSKAALSRVRSYRPDCDSRTQICKTPWWRPRRTAPLSPAPPTRPLSPARPAGRDSWSWHPGAVSPVGEIRCSSAHHKQPTCHPVLSKTRRMRAGPMRATRRLGPRATGPGPAQTVIGLAGELRPALLVRRPPRLVPALWQPLRLRRPTPSGRARRLRRCHICCRRRYRCRLPRPHHQSQRRREHRRLSRQQHQNG